MKPPRPTAAPFAAVRNALALACFAAASAAQSDDCAAPPFLVGPGSYPSSVVGFTVASATPTCDLLASNGDGWYVYVPTQVGWTTVSLCPGDGGSMGTFAPGQAVLQIWDAFACPVVNPVACSAGDPCCGMAPRVSFPVVVGQIFYVQIDYAGAGPPVGADTFTVGVVQSSAPPPPGFNDECVCAWPVFDGCNGPYSNASATTSSPTGSCGFIGNDLWFVYTPLAPLTGCTAFISTCGSGFDTVLSVWNFCPAAGGNEIACNDDSPKKTWPACFGTSQSYVEVPLTPGQTYYICVGGFAGATGSFQLNIRTQYTYLIEEPAPGFILARHVNGCPNDFGLAVVHAEFSTSPYFIGGECPHVGAGAFFGINASWFEVFFALSNFFSLTPPFFAALDGCGDASSGPFPWPGPLPYLDVVGFSLTPGSLTTCAVAPPVRYL
jgi:hypothetical protein